MPCFNRRKKKRKKMPTRVFTVSSDNRQHNVLITESSLPTLAPHVPIISSTPHRGAVEKIRRSKASKLRSIFLRGNKRALRRKKSFDSVASLHSINGITYDDEIERRRSRLLGSRSSTTSASSFRSSISNAPSQCHTLAKVVISMVLFILLAYNLVFVSTVLIRM